jgi:plastocyanin
MRRLPPRLAIVVAVTLALAMSACGGGGGSDKPAEPGVVVVDDNVFKPKTIEIKAGETVTWRFEGSSAHNVTFDDFNSKLMKEGTFEHTFDEAGNFSYKCTVHTGMTGKVSVS